MTSSTLKRPGNMIVRLSILAVLLAFTVFASALTTSTGTAHAASFAPHSPLCYGDYPVGSSVSGGDSSGAYTVQLWYNSCSGNNYGVVTFTSYYGSFTGYAIIEREAGTDGGALSQSYWCSLGGSGTCYSPAVHSPNNRARACFDDHTSYGTYICTNWY